MLLIHVQTLILTIVKTDQLLTARLGYEECNSIAERVDIAPPITNKSVKNSYS